MSVYIHTIPVDQSAPMVYLTDNPSTDLPNGVSPKPQINAGIPLASSLGILWSQLAIAGVPVGPANPIPVSTSAGTPSISWLVTGSLSAAALVAIYTPPTGKKINLYGIVLDMTGDSSLSLAGENTILVQDQANIIIGRTPNLPAVSANVFGLLNVINMSFSGGYTFASANDVLGISIGTAFATGRLNYTAWGSLV